MSNKHIELGVIISTIFFLVVQLTASVELRPEECLNLTSNGSYMIQYCAPSACSMNVTLGQNQTFINTTGSCDLNVTTFPTEICTLNEVVGLNSTYNNTLGVCNVTVKTPDYTCPACSIQPKCEIKQRLTAKENESVEWGQYDNYCSINITTEPVPVCPTYRLLQNQSIIDITALNKLSDAAAFCGTYAGMSSVITQERDSYKYKAESLQASIDALCNVNDTVLYEGWKKLSTTERNNLLFFASQKRMMYYEEFSNFLNPAVLTDEARANVDVLAANILKDYRTVDFASDYCVINVYNGRNITSCGYSPTVNPACVGRARYIDELESKANTSGRNNGVTLTSIVMIVFYAVLVLDAQWGPAHPKI